MNNKRKRGKFCQLNAKLGDKLGVRARLGPLLNETKCNLVSFSLLLNKTK